MSLLDRVDSNIPDNVTMASSSREENELCDEMRGKLYSQLPSSVIAGLVSRNLELASREVSGTLELIMRSSEYRWIDESEKSRIARRVMDMVLGLGPLQPLMNDTEVTEIMANGPEKIFFEKNGVLHEFDETFESVDQMRSVIDKILGPVGRRVDEQSPMVSARLPGGHRANIVISPLALDGPYITIRKFRERMFTMDELVDSGTLDRRLADYLVDAVVSRRNIAVSGGTGSGKTTFLNALSGAIPSGERVITIEDSAELRFDTHPHVVRLEARPVNVEGKGEVTIRDLVTNALRMRPDRIIVGECRGAEALDVLQAMNTGHEGSLTTLHANSTEEVMGRLVAMVRFGSELPVDVIEEQVSSAIDVIVHLKRMKDGRRKVVEVSEYTGSSRSRVFSKVAEWDENAGEYSWLNGRCSR